MGHNAGRWSRGKSAEGRCDGPLLGHLLLRAFDRARRIHLAMTARGFDGELRSLRTLRWRPCDTRFVLGWCGAFALIRAVDLPQCLGAALLGLGR